MKHTGSLDGIRVLDLTRVLAGPFCTMMLGDMGAEILKIEEPNEGDDSRGWAPAMQGWSSYFIGLNRNKKSVTLDLKSPDGAEAFRRLIRTADILIENFRPQTLARLGFGYDAVEAMNPQLIYCSISGYGQSGPRSHLAGYDPVLQAEAGLMEVTGFPEQPPTRVGIAVTDYFAGLFALSGILLALRTREQSGRGQYLDIALFDSLMATMTLPVGIYLASGQTPSRVGNRHPSIAPYETFAGSDGAVMICAGNPRLWVNLCRAIGRPELADDPRFSTNEDRLRHRALLVTELEAILKTMTVQEVIDRLGEHHVPCGRVRSVADALEDPQLLAREMVVEMPHDDLGAVTVIGNPIKLSRTPASYRLAPPQLGEHTAEVLRTLAYTDADVERIVAATRSQGHPGAPVVS